LDEPPPPAEIPGAAFWNFEETPPGQNLPTTGTFANGNAVWIGRYNNNTRQLTGDIDFVRITPAALEPDRFAGKRTQFDAHADHIPN
jgi:hypothetical protein